MKSVMHDRGKHSLKHRKLVCNVNLKKFLKQNGKSVVVNALAFTFL